MQSGLLPVTQEAIICGDASYYDFKGAVTDSEESDKVARALGPRNKARIYLIPVYRVEQEAVQKHCGCDVPPLPHQSLENMTREE